MRSMHLMPLRGDKPEWQQPRTIGARRTSCQQSDLDGDEFVYAGSDVASAEPVARIAEPVDV